jgi:hypothetical protein
MKHTKDVFGPHIMVVVPCTLLPVNLHEENHFLHPFDVKTILLLMITLIIVIFATGL